MTSKLTATIRAAETLKSLSGSEGNPLKALMAYFEPVLYDAREKRFEPEIFSRRVAEAYGWNFNAEVAEGFRMEFIKAKWLTPKRNKYGGILVDDKGYFHTVTPPPEYENIYERESFDDRIDNILNSFRKFIDKNSLSPIYDLLTDDDLLDRILSWLLNERPDETGDGKISEYSTDIDITGRISDQDRYVIARFVKDNLVNETPLADELDRLVSVGLLVDLAQDFRKPKSSVKKTRVHVLLDSPVALDLLGTSGSDAQRLAESIVSKLTQMGAQIEIFDESIRELQNTMRAILYAPPDERFGPTQEALVNRETSEVYIQALIADPGPILSKRGIRIRRAHADKKESSQYFFNEAQYQELFNLLMNYHDDERDYEKRCRHDASAAMRIMRLRAGDAQPDMFGVSHFFLTRNRPFSSIVKNFCVKKDMIDSTCVGPFVNMHEMAASLWLRTGLYSSQEIPRRKLLVGCNRVLNRNSKVVGEAKRAILRLKAEAHLDEERVSQIEAIVMQDRSMLLLSDKVRAAGGHVTQEDISRVLEEYSKSEQNIGFAKGQEEITADLEEARERNRRYQEFEKKSLDEIDKLRRERDIRAQEDRYRLDGFLDEVNRSIGRQRVWLRVIIVLLIGLLLAGALGRDVYEFVFGEISIFDPEISASEVGMVSAAFLLALVSGVDVLLKALGIRVSVERWWFERRARAQFENGLEERGLTGVVSNPLSLRYVSGRLEHRAALSDRASE